MRVNSAKKHDKVKLEKFKVSSSKSIEILSRLKKITRVKTDSGLSEVLGVSPQTLSSWKGRDRIPYSVCMELAQAQGISLDWLFSGQGAMFLQKSTVCVELSGRLSVQEIRMIMMFRTLKHSEQGDVYKVVKEKQKLHRLVRQVEELSARLESESARA